MQARINPMAYRAGGGEELKLLGAWLSPFVHRVCLALHLKGLTSYEYVEEDLTNKSDLLLASNPVHKIPVLLHGGNPVFESLVILQYLDDAFPDVGPALLPTNPYDRVVACFWVTYADHISLKGTTEEERAVGAEGALAALLTLECAFGECSKGKPFFAGDRPGYMDVALGGYVGWMRAYEAVAGVNLLDAAGPRSWWRGWSASPRLTPPRGSSQKSTRSSSWLRRCRHEPLQLLLLTTEKFQYVYLLLLLLLLETNMDMLIWCELTCCLLSVL